MKIQNKIMLLVSGLAALFAVASYIYISNESHRVNNLFTQWINEKRNTFNKVLEIESFNLTTIIYEEYGLWDDMTNFANNPTKEFSSYNLDWMLEGYNLSAIWVLNSENKLVYSKLSDPSRIPPLPDFPGVVFDSLIALQENHFFAYQNGELYEFISTTLHPNYEEYLQNINHGLMIVARSFDEKIKNYLQQLSGSFIEQMPYYFSEDLNPHIDYDSGTSSFKEILNGWNKQPLAFLLVSVHSEFVKEFHEKTDSIFIIYLVTCFSIILIFYFLHKVMINKPLNAISTSLNTENLEHIYGYAGSKNEIGILSRLIIKFFEQKKELVKEIEEKKLAQESLREINEQLESIVDQRTKEINSLIEHSLIAKLILNVDGKLIGSNKKFKETFSRINDSCKDIQSIMGYFNIDLEQFNSNFEKLINEGIEFTIPPLSIKFKSGALCDIADKWFAFKFYNIVSDRNELLKIVCLIDDITDIQKYEEAKRKIEEQNIISETILEAQENERKRISMELHDGIGQLLMSTRLSLIDYIKKNSITNQNLHNVKNMISGIGRELVNIINYLHPIDLEKYGLENSLKSLCKEFSSLIGFNIVCNAFDLPKKIPFKYEITIYRIVQEALRNIYRHSRASEASVQLFFRDGSLFLEINDNGIGFSTAGSSQPIKEGRGILNMIKRTEYLNGKCTVESKPDYGTEIHLIIPVKYEN